MFLKPAFGIPERDSPLKVLIVKVGSAGDVVMALSMLEVVRRQEPDSQITWLCGAMVEPLVRDLGRVGEIITVDERKLLKGGAWGAFCSVFRVWAKLSGRRFDLIVTGHSDWRYRLLSWPAFAKVRRGFGMSHGRRLPAPGRYHADEYARLISGQDGPEIPSVPLCIHQPPLSGPLQQKLGPGKGSVALAPGGAKNILRDDALRRWPLESYVRLAGKFLEKGFRVLITGSESDVWIRDSFHSLPIIDLIGQTSLTDLVALYSHCHLVVTHDSGPLHLAEAAGVPVLGLFGPTIPWEKVPRSPKVRVLWGGEALACRPCYDGKNYARCADNQCLKCLTPEKVYQEAEGLLKVGG
jgi:heptosyltransferase II